MRGVCSGSTFRLRANRTVIVLKIELHVLQGGVTFFCVKGFSGKSDENNKIAVSATLDGKLSWFKRKLLD